MAEKKKSMGFDEIKRNLKAGNFSPIYILMGNEAYYIDKIADYIAENALAPEERDFNQEIVFGADTTATQIVDMAKGYPMMAPRRVIIVKEAQGLKNLEPIEKYLANSDYFCLVKVKTKEINNYDLEEGNNHFMLACYQINNKRLYIFEFDKEVK